MRTRYSRAKMNSFVAEPEICIESPLHSWHGRRSTSEQTLRNVTPCVFFFLPIFSNNSVAIWMRQPDTIVTIVVSRSRRFAIDYNTLCLPYSRCWLYAANLFVLPIVPYCRTFYWRFVAIFLNKLLCAIYLQCIDCNASIIYIIMHRNNINYI